MSEATGVDDRARSVTEPFREWVLSGTFPAGRPRWEEAGATFADDIVPFEHRKLWLLNGAHSLLAYAGAVRGHETVADAVADDEVPRWLEQWWTEASRHLEPAARTSSRPTAAPCSTDSPTRGSATCSPRSPPTARRSCRSGSCRRAAAGARRRADPAGATLVLGAWVCHLRGAGTPVVDVRADDIVPLAAGPLPDAVRRVADRSRPGPGRRRRRRLRGAAKPPNSSAGRAGHDTPNVRDQWRRIDVRHPSRRCRFAEAGRDPVRVVRVRGELHRSARSSSARCAVPRAGVLVAADRERRRTSRGRRRGALPVLRSRGRLVRRPGRAVGRDGPAGRLRARPREHADRPGGGQRRAESSPAATAQ